MSLIIFIDSFDLFCNTYRFLIDIYAILASITLIERNRRANVFFITLELHGSELFDIIIAISLSFAQLDRGIFTQIKNGKDLTIFLCVYILTFIDNLLQQSNNKELLRLNANYRCSQYYIYKQ